jgi:ABC-type uncharacterized transport system permease subunit
MSLMTSLHAINRWVVLTLVLLHFAAIAWYVMRKQQTLVRPMVTGDRSGVEAVPADDETAVHLRAVIFMLLAAALVGCLVTL